MKYKFLIVLAVLMLAFLVSAAVPVDITWTTSGASGNAAMNVPFPGWADSSPSTDPIPVNPETPLLNPLATISQSLVDDLFE